MFEGFERFQVQTSDPEARIAGRIGGKGQPLLLYGNPLTYVTLQRITRWKKRRSKRTLRFVDSSTPERQ